MTVSVQTCRTTGVAGSGAVGQEIAFTFPFAATSEIVVKTKVTATGVEATLAETTNYTVSAASETGGTVTTVTAVAATSTIHVMRVTPKTQALDLAAGGDFGAEAIEDAFDKMTKLIIEARDTADRALRMPDTDVTATASMVLPSVIDRASKYLTFSAAGLPTVTSAVTPTGAITLSGFGAAWGVAADATAGIALLSLGTSAVRNLDTDGTLAANLDTLIPTQKAVKTYADTKIATTLACALAGAQNITGVKTFAVSPIVPTPTTDMQAATKLYADSQDLLLSTTTVAFNVNAATTLYTVPSGKRCVLSHAIVVAGADAGATKLSIGASTAVTDFVPACTLSNLDAQYDAVKLQPIMAATPVKNKSYAAGVLIVANVTANAGGATNTVYLYGSIYDA